MCCAYCTRLPVWDTVLTLTANLGEVLCCGVLTLTAYLGEILCCVVLLCVPYLFTWVRCCAAVWLPYLFTWVRWCAYPACLPGWDVVLLCVYPTCLPGWDTVLWKSTWKNPEKPWIITLTHLSMSRSCRQVLMRWDTRGQLSRLTVSIPLQSILSCLSGFVQNSPA